MNMSTMSMSGRGCVAWGGEEKNGTEEWERLRGGREDGAGHRRYSKIKQFKFIHPRWDISHIYMINLCHYKEQRKNSI